MDMVTLAIVSAYGGARVAMLGDDAEPVRGAITAEQGPAAALPALVAELIARAGLPDCVAVVTGPGSFTGLRAGLSVAHGIALGAGVPLIGVTVAEALAEAAAPVLDGRRLWIAIAARTGRVFIEAEGALGGHALDDLPRAVGRVAVSGNAANQVAAALAARGTDVMLTALRDPHPDDVAAVARRRLASGTPGGPVLPVYVDAALARPQAGGRGPPCA